MEIDLFRSQQQGHCSIAFDCIGLIIAIGIDS
jgi:hypothetical protein